MLVARWDTIVAPESHNSEEAGGDNSRLRTEVNVRRSLLSFQSSFQALSAELQSGITLKQALLRLQAESDAQQEAVGSFLFNWPLHTMTSWK